MTFQIILLPRGRYWAWVRASKDYVLRYGVNLTPDPETAARYMAPHQVVTFPDLPGGFPEIGDLRAWFEARHPGIRLDPVPADSPEAFQERLRRRIENEDRFGQKERPFFLLWPTDYPVVTQPFGANPQIYTRFGMPGHEGVDIRALLNTNVYCCADGVVYMVHTDPESHAYGVHVRVQHRDGYKTVYAHLAKALVEVGDQVAAGQVIGKADSTGASTGSHLHLTLKREGATRRGETTYPKDVIDPTPFLVWPEERPQTTSAKTLWTAGRCLVGAHGRVEEPLEEADLRAIETARLEAVKLCMKERKETLDRLRAIDPGMMVVVRLTADFSHEPVSPRAFLAQVRPEVERLYGLGVRYYEVHANPNLQVAGWQRSWMGGREFARWFQEVVGALKATFPEAQFGFPGLSPGEAVSGWRADARQFLLDAEPAILEADWVGVNVYWTDPQALEGLHGARAVDEYRLLFPEKMLFVTEFNNPSPGADPAVKANQYVEFYRMLREGKGIGAAFAFALSAPRGHESVVWRREDGGLTAVPEVVGRRGF